MVERFKFWLESIVEDDPLPDEIGVIVFIVSNNGEYKNIALKGFEKKFIDNVNTYFPLEAESHFDKELSMVDDSIFYVRLKTIIDESFASKYLALQFKNRKIYILYKNELHFLFKV